MWLSYTSIDKSKLKYPIKYENVMIGAIYSSIRYNFKKIFLFGVDHDWIKSLTVNHNNELQLI